MRKEVSGHVVIEHGGAWQGFTSHIARYINDKLSIVVLANLSAESAGPSVDKISRHVAERYIPDVRGSHPETPEQKRSE